MVRPNFFGLQLVAHALERIVYGSRNGLHDVSRKKRIINGAAQAFASVWVT